MNRSHFACFFPLLLVACEEPPPEPEPPARAAPKPAATPVASGAIDLGGRAAATATAAVRPLRSPASKISAKPVAEVKPSEDDPLKGKFTLADATGGLTGKGSAGRRDQDQQGDFVVHPVRGRGASLVPPTSSGWRRGLRPWKTPRGASGRRSPATTAPRFTGW